MCNEVEPSGNTAESVIRRIVNWLDGSSKDDEIGNLINKYGLDVKFRRKPKGQK